MKESFPEYYEYFDKILKVVSNLVSKLIKVKRLTAANKYNSTVYDQQQSLCKKKKVSEQDVTHGIDNSDLHIYIFPTNETSFA